RCEFICAPVRGIAPNRRLDAVHLPHFAVCKSDLPASYFFAARLEGSTEQWRDAIGLGQRQSARPRGEGRNLAMAGKRRDDLVGDGFNIEHLGQCGHIRTLSEVMEGTSERNISIRANVRLWPQKPTFQ